MKHKRFEYKEIDFSPLAAIKTPWWKNISTEDSIRLIVVATLVFIVVSFISIDLAVLSFLILGISVMLFLTVNEVDIEAKADSVLADFANLNKFSFTRYGDNKWGPGSLFTHGRKKQMSTLIEGNISGLPFKFFNYRYVQGLGDYSHDFKTTVFMFKLPHKLPHMVIDSIVDSGYDSLSTLPVHFDQSQRITLEGDFSRYFALYALDKHAVSALTILAPDVMESIMRYAQLCDMEIIDKYMYFYWPETAVNERIITDKFHTVQTVLSETYTKITRADLLNEEPVKQISVKPVECIRLKESQYKPYIYALGVYLGLNYLPVLFPSTPDISILVIPGFLIWIGWKFYHRFKLQNMLSNRFENK